MLLISDLIPMTRPATLEALTSPDSTMSRMFCRGTARLFIGSGISVMFHPNSSMKVVKFSGEAMASLSGSKADAIPSARAAMVSFSAISFTLCERGDRLLLRGFYTALSQTREMGRRCRTGYYYYPDLGRALRRYRRPDNLYR